MHTEGSRLLLALKLTLTQLPSGFGESLRQFPKRLLEMRLTYFTYFKEDITIVCIAHCGPCLSVIMKDNQNNTLTVRQDIFI